MHATQHATANKIDRTYNDYQGSRGSGPVSLKLASYGRIRGLAVGAFGEGEGSDDLVISVVYENGQIGSTDQVRGHGGARNV